MTEHTYAYTPPFSEEAERAIIGAILLDPLAVLPMVFTANCKADWFYVPQCKAAFKAIENLSLDNKFIDLVVVCAHPLIANAGLVEYVHESVGLVTSVTATPHYLDIVKEAYYKRCMLSLLREHEEKICSGNDVQDVLTSLMFDVSAVDKYATQKAVRNVDEVVEDILAMYAKCTSEGHVGLPSRWLRLQHKTCGYWRGKNTIIAARPGVGKSTFARNEALSLASQGFAVALISLEMSTDEVYRIMACEKAGVDSFKYNRGEFTAIEYEKFVNALEEIKTYPLYICDNVRDAKHICNWIRRMNKKYDLAMVILDYIQLVTMDSKSNRTTQVSEISKAMLSVASDCDIANLILSQLNRGAEPPPNAKPEDRWKYVPKLHNLKESGALEEDAHVAILLYPKPDEDVDSSEMIVAAYVFSIEKNRGGPTGKVYPTFRKDIQRFVLNGIGD